MISLEVLSLNIQKGIFKNKKKCSKFLSYARRSTPTLYAIAQSSSLSYILQLSLNHLNELEKFSSTFYVIAIDIWKKKKKSFKEIFVPSLLVGLWEMSKFRRSINMLSVCMRPI